MPCAGSTVRNRRRICGSSSINTTIGCGSLIAVRRFDFGERTNRLTRLRQHETEAHAAPGTIVGAYVSALRFDDGAADGEAESGAAGGPFRMRAIELVEHALLLARQESDAVVG